MQSSTHPHESADHDSPLWPTLLRWGLFNAALFALVCFLLPSLLVGVGLGLPEHPVSADSSLSGTSETGPLTMDATVVNEKAKDITAAFGGRVRSLEVRRGQRVSKGQLLFRMDAAEVRRRMRAARLGTARTGAAVTLAYAGRERALPPLKARASSLGVQVERQRSAWHTRQEQVRAARSRNRPAATARATGEMKAALVRLKALKKEHAAATARLAAAERAWHERVVAAIRDHEDAKTGVRPLQALLKQQNRYSPAAGIVSSIRAAAGQWVAGGAPVVRVDDPSGYRIVALVGEEARGRLNDGAVVPGEVDGKTVSATLTRIEAGTGRELFRYWVYLKPEDPRGLRSEETVRLSLPTTVAGADGRAEEVAAAD